MPEKTPLPQSSKKPDSIWFKKIDPNSEAIVYELKEVKVVRGFESRTKTKWVGQGWEFVSEEQSTLNSRMQFRREKRQLSSLSLLVAGGSALALAAIIAIGAINEQGSANLVQPDPDKSTGIVTEEPTPEPEVTVEPEPEVTEEPEPEGPVETISQSNARSTAEDYIAYSGFSRSGLIDQLKYEEYSTADATYAVDAIDVDWNEQAARTAQSYLDTSSFSRSGLYDQLIYEGYTSSQANYGLKAVGY